MEVNQGSWNAGSNINNDTYASVELLEGAKFSREDYENYVNLLRQLADDAGIPKRLDRDGKASGIKTHNFVTRVFGATDHVDPQPFLEYEGISFEQFQHDVENGFGEGRADVAPIPQPGLSTPSAYQAFKDNNKFTAFKVFRVDEIKKVNGIWQVANYWLAGGKDGFDWTLNGIPWAILDNTTRSNAVNIQVGDMVKFDENNNSGTIDKYDTASNGVGVVYGNYGVIWYAYATIIKID